MESRWKNADSAQFLSYAVERCGQHNAELRHLDLTIICEAPKITLHRDAMRARIAEILEVSTEQVSVKATTTVRLMYGTIGTQCICGKGKLKLKQLRPSV